MKFKVLLETQNKLGDGAKEGDIIAIRDVKWEFGVMERKLYLIAIADFGSDIEDAADAQQLTISDYGSGYLTHPPDDAPWPVRQAKRRYSLPFATVDAVQTGMGNAVDWNRVKDLNDTYQPIEAEAAGMSYTGVVYDKVQKRLVTKADIDAIVAAIGKSGGTTSGLK